MSEPDMALEACYAVSQEDAPPRQRFAWRAALSEYMDDVIDASEMERRIDHALNLDAR